MKKLAILALLIASFVFTFAAPQRVILDTDLGNDIDDALALAMLFNLQKSGAVDIAAILINKDNPLVPEYLGLLSKYYGAEKIPVGMLKLGTGATRGEDKYIGKVLRAKNADGSPKYPRPEHTDVSDSVRLARSILAASPDKSIAYISIGFSTNIARLLQSNPDNISPLSGAQLAAKKIKVFSVMAGQFGLSRRVKTFRPEFNIYNDLPAAKFFLENPPAPVVLSGFEVGEELTFPQQRIVKFIPETNPLRESYFLYCGTPPHCWGGRLWDLTSVLYIVNPAAFDISARGSIAISETGLTNFTPNKNGLCRYLKIRPSEEHKLESIIGTLAVPDPAK